MPTFGIFFFGTILLSFAIGAFAAIFPVRLRTAWGLGSAPALGLNLLWALMVTSRMLRTGPLPGDSEGGPSSIAEVWMFSAEWAVAVLLFSLAGVLLVHGAAAALRALRALLQGHRE